MRCYLECVDCIYYEPNHQYPNPNAQAQHYCMKCRAEIYYSYVADRYILPRACYFNHYFEESKEGKERRLEYERNIQAMYDWV